MNNYWQQFTSKRKVSRRRALALAASGVSGAALLAACGGDDDDSGDSSGNTSTNQNGGEGEPRRGGRFGLAANPTANWNPVQNYTDFMVQGSTVYDRLISTVAGEKQYKLEAAASVETPEKTQVVFKLKSGMVYQNKVPVNGRPVKSEDVKASQEYVASFTRAYDRAFQQNFIDRIETPDASTVILHLKKPDGYLFSFTHLGSPQSQMIIPPEMLAVLDDTPPVGSGPYQLAEHQFGTRYLYERFPQYREASKEMPYTDQREFFTITDTAAIEAAFRSGQIHAWYHTAPSNVVDRVVSESSGSILLGKGLGLQYFGLHMNMDKNGLPWQKDARVRQAFYRLINRQQWLDLIFQGKGVVPSGTIPAGLADYQLDTKETAQYYKYDVKEAKSLLDAAGFDYGHAFDVPIMGSTTAPQALGGEILAQQASELGVKFTIRAGLPVSQMLVDIMGPGNYDLTIGSSPADDTPAKAIRLFHSDQQNLFGHFGVKSPAVDALIERSEATLDFNENVKLVREIQREALKAYAPTICLVTPDYLTLYSSKLVNYEINPVPLALYRNDMWFKA